MLAPSMREHIDQNSETNFKDFGGPEFVDGESPVTVEFEIDRISAYQIDDY